MKVYGTFGNPRALKVQVVASYAGVDVQSENVTWEQVKEQKFAEISPLQKVPVLTTPEGPIYESNAICRFIARKGQNLYGANDFQAAQVDQYLDFFSSEVEPALFAILYPMLGYGDAGADAERVKRAGGDFQQGIRVFENLLKGKNYLVNDTLSVADLVLASGLNLMFRCYMDEKQRKALPNITKFYTNLAGQDKFKKIYGDVVLCQKLFPSFSSGVKEAPKKEEKKAEAKKEAPKKEAPKKTEDEGDMEEKKAKNPLDNLPPSTFNLYDFKTLIANAKDKKEACAEFWKQYDPTGYSIWHIHYDKYEGEGENFTHTRNLMAGFLQRLDHFRKHSFGCLGIYGQEPDLNINGVFVWRSTGKPAEITEHAQYDYHVFRKMDEKNEKDRAILEEYWCNLAEGTMVEGAYNQESKYFK